MKQLEIVNVSASYDARTVLESVNLSLEKGSLTALVGPNGAGKSTLLKCILGLMNIDTGSVQYHGQGPIAYVPQHLQVNWDFPITVYEAVMMGCYQELPFFKKPGPTQHQKVKQALARLGLEDLSARHISQLSGGQKQRVFIARALCQASECILMDEPLAGVDKKSEQIIMDLAKQLTQTGITILCVHHDLNTIKRYFEDVILVNKQVVVHGRVADVYTTENIEAAYV